MRTSIMSKASQASFSASTIKAFASLCVAKPELAMDAVRTQSEPEVILKALSAYPGALEKLLRAENCPRYLKASITEVLEENGEFILS